MDRGIKKDIAEENKTPFNFKIIDLPENGTLNSEVSDTQESSKEFLSTETVPFLSLNVADDSSECLLLESVASNSLTAKNDSIGTSNANISSLESVMELAKSETRDELIESIASQQEEIEEMLDMISRAKVKLELFISHVENLVKSLQGISKHSPVISRSGNSYLQSIYRKKLEEFASGILFKIQKSIKGLEADYETLKEREKKIDDSFKEIVELHRISDSYTAKVGKITAKKVKETVEHLEEELCLLKPKQLSEIEKVYYIETDIEMVYDLYRRCSSIEVPSLIRF